jgi:predicted Holliday junction resolvase-like endonuclease
MDILSFILGMSVVVVIALAVVAVIGLVRVNRVKSQINDITQYMERDKEETNRRVDETFRYMDERFVRLDEDFKNEIGNVYRTIDSRFDKLENKINNNGPVKTKWHGYESLNK